MKKIFLLLSFIYSLSVLAQTPPQLVNFQAVARNASGNVMTGTTIDVEFKICTDASGINSIYGEEHTVTTNSFGLFNVRIGEGIPQSTTFSSIDWAQSQLYLKTTINFIFKPALRFSGGFFL